MARTPPTVVYLLRHGAVAFAERERFIGHLDVPLSERGEAQSAVQAARLRRVPLAAVVTSDLARARRTGAILAAPHGLTPAVIPALREMSMGRWEGLTASEISMREPAAFEEWMSRVGEFPFPEGESLPDLLARAWPAFEGLVSAFAGQRIVVVAHGGTNRALLCRALGVSLDRLLSFGQDYAALTVLERADGRWGLRRLNEQVVL